MNGKIPVVAVVGPTASGKTALGVEIAKRFDGEIISADSMQVYRELSIATAKPTKAETQGIAHHMMDFLSVSESFSAAQYCDMANSIVKEVYSRQKLPVIVGGTGLYVDSLLDGVDFSVQRQDDALRQRLCGEYDEYGAEYMHNKLAKVDEAAALSIHRNNKKRLIRALELYELTGQTQKQRNELSQKNSPYIPLYICLNFQNRQNLYERINRRVDKMMKDGLLDEVKAYYRIKDTATASQAIGCKELKPYLDGANTLENCVDKLKQSTRRYAKRQLTWFLRNDKINIMYVDEMSGDELLEKAFALVKDFLKTKKEC